MVDPTQWGKVRRLFHAVLDSPSGERNDFLAAQGADPLVLQEVRELLQRHEDPATFLDAPWVGSSDKPPSPRIGPYEIKDVLGRGGMGTVYRAVRVDGAYQTQVAIKLLHPELVDAQTERRFRRERQILADLEHPSIARLLDGGTTEDGRQFLVLEYVPGEPIDRYCDSQQLSIRQRLDLFRQVCSTVHFAHQSLVVHRDLKPGNILVTAEGELKLLDFGIAKLLGAYEGDAVMPVTGTAQSPMTPEFASPEQMQGKAITTATDVYALGNLLYLLLSGQRPFRLSDRSPRSFLDAVCFEDPELPSALLRRNRMAAETGDGYRRVAADRGTDPGRLEKMLAGDLDNIVARALRKDPRYRYLSALDLAEDVRRYLDNEPVAAREQTFWYRTGKFVRRNRWPVAAAVGLLAGAVVFAGAMWQQQQRVSRERSHSREVTQFLEGLFEISDPDQARGERITARELLDRGSVDIRNRLEGQPALQARLMATMSRVYRKLGLYKEAAPLAREALDLRQKAYYGGPHLEVAESLLDLGEQALAEGEYGPSLQHFEASLAMFRQVGAARSESAVRALSGSSRACQLQGNYDRARQLRQQSLDRAIEVLGETHPLVAANQNELGGLLREQGEYEAAGESYGAALALYRDLYGENHPKVADLYNDLGLLYDEQGKFEDARQSFSKALSIQGDVYEGSHPELASVRHNLAALLYRQGHLEEAETQARLAVESRRQALGQRHPNVADSLNLLGMIHHQKGDRVSAEALLREALEMWTELLGEDFVKVGAARTNLSQVLQANGDLEGADRELTEALRIYRKTFGKDHLQIATVLSERALVDKRQGNLEAARQGYEASVEMLTRLLGSEHPEVAKVTHNLAVVIERLGQPEAAEPHFRGALASLEKSLLPGHLTLGVVHKNLASALFAQGQTLEAEAELLKALKIFESQNLEEDNEVVLATRGMLGATYTAQGRFEAAETILLKCVELARGRYEEGAPVLVGSLRRLEQLHEARNQVPEAGPGG